MAEIGLLSLGDHSADPYTGRQTTQAERVREIVDAAVLAEQVGVSSVWIGEHHYSHWIVPSPQLVLASIAEHTSTLRLGTGVTLMSTDDPVRIAEDFSVLDLISGGRAELVCGKGILKRTFTAAGLDFDDSPQLMAENLELLLRLWREEDVTWSGSFRAPLSDITMQPRPMQSPHPRVWMAGGSDSSVDLAVALQLPLMLPSAFSRPEAYEPFARRYRERWEEVGNDPDGMLVGGCNHLYVSTTTTELARERWRPYYYEYFQFAQRELLEGGANQGAKFLERKNFDYEGILRGPGICGAPDAVIERILEIQELLTLDVHLLMVDLGGMPYPEVAETIQVLGSEVMPHVDAAPLDRPVHAPTPVG
jgi:alkanesulfonate monooxygenase SsuD/methylene tetrahydromethanopterin reductase-like flavin-dependent oxidoreductase (luciferase family)